VRISDDTLRLKSLAHLLNTHYSFNWSTLLSIALGGPEMSNLRNCHALSLRTEFAAAGSCWRLMCAAAAIVSSRFGTALSDVAAPIDDPGGGPGG
jgi:hypothetical protein